MCLPFFFVAWVRLLLLLLVRFMQHLSSLGILGIADLGGGLQRLHHQH
jgi:hypothetical protein